MASALILTYHAVEVGPAPLCVDPQLFAAHADAVAQSGLRAVTVHELASDLRAGRSGEGSVVLTFDDGFASVVDTAVPMLCERGLTATVFCVGGHLGGMNDWPSARDGGFGARLADATAIRELAEAGFEIGSHGMEHAPLSEAPDDLLRCELVDSRSLLEDVTGRPVSSYAYPYGALPSRASRELLGRTYDAACTTSLGRAGRGSDPYLLPRVDAHYVRDPELLTRALGGGLAAYLRARGLAARARRLVVKDYRPRSSPNQSA